MAMIIGNKVVEKLRSYHPNPNSPSCVTTYLEFKGGDLFPLCWEFEVTNGLGYKKLGYHEDNQKGLTRHLAVMDSAVWDNYSMIKYGMRKHLGFALDASENARHLEGKTYKEGLKEIVNSVDSLKKSMKAQAKEDREFISKMMAEMVPEISQTVNERYPAGEKIIEDAFGATKPEKRSLFKQFLSWIQ